jgi:hypothetical protein
MGHTFQGVYADVTYMLQEEEFYSVSASELS